MARRFPLSRRGLLLGGVGIASLFAIGGASKVLVGEGNLLRPPGAQNENTLLGACIKCDRCRSACPTNVIDVAHLEDGFVNARTPHLSFRKGYCNFCEDREDFRCVESCPTQAIGEGFDPQREKIGMAFIDTQECLLYRSGSHSCPKPCIDACKFEALFYNEDTNQLYVDENTCNGCGACEFVCISSSYASYTGSNRRGINVESWEGDPS